MAKSSTLMNSSIPRGAGSKRSEKTIVKLKLVVEMFQKITVLPAGISKKYNNNNSHYNDVEEDEVGSSAERCRSGGGVPADVKEGHFAVIAATEEGGVKRFVVPLSYLEYPPFMRLLKEAEEEYGFDHHDGALTLPCHPTELEIMLLSHSRHQQAAPQRKRRTSGSFMLNRMTNWVALST